LIILKLCECHFSSDSFEQNNNIKRKSLKRSAVPTQSIDEPNKKKSKLENILQTGDPDDKNNLKESKLLSESKIYHFIHIILEVFEKGMDNTFIICQKT
jgi:hypothetical protein